MGANWSIFWKRILHLTRWILHYISSVQLQRQYTNAIPKKHYVANEKSVWNALLLGKRAEFLYLGCWMWRDKQVYRLGICCWTVWRSWQNLSFTGLVILWGVHNVLNVNTKFKYIFALYNAITLYVSYAFGCFCKWITTKFVSILGFL